MRYFSSFFLSLSIFLFLSQKAYALEQKQAPHPVFAKISQSQTFSLPLNCKLGENCWVMNYVDIGTDDGIKTDPACYSNTYDNHKGTDFAILDEKTMKNGVDVIAPMEGTVLKIRDGEPDLWATKEQLEQIKAERKECGNAIIIDHGDGLQSIYCHMKKGSIIVKPKQKIKLGDKIGQVGLSGYTEFPHLHFGILKNEKVIDPFTGQDNKGTCGQLIQSWWNSKINVNYQPFTIQSIGFSDKIPELKDLEKNNFSPNNISKNSNSFIFWTILFGIEKGDKITLKINDPNGKVFVEQSIVQDKSRAQQFYYIGKNIKNHNVKEGAYSGEINITRTTQKGIDVTKNKFIGVLVTE